MKQDYCGRAPVFSPVKIDKRGIIHSVNIFVEWRSARRTETRIVSEIGVLLIVLLFQIDPIWLLSL